MHGTHGVVAATLVSALLMPASAFGSDAGVSGAQIFVSARPGEANNVTISISSDRVTIKDLAHVSAHQGCAQADPDTVRCSAEPTIMVSTTDGDDRVLFDSSMEGFLAQHRYPLLVADGGAGDDQLAFAGVPLNLSWAARLVGGPGADDLRGPGATVDYGGITSGPITVTLDGIANDGNLDDESAGRRDNLGPGMSVDGTDFGDSMVGDAGANSFRGDKGDDVLTGGGGSDYLSGGAGNDTIDARDGGSDAANCGSGDDHARTDALGVDRVSSCEHVDSPADACAPMDRFLAAHPSPNHLGTPSRPKNGGLYIGKTIFGLPVRLNISADGRSFVPASRLSYKWCAKHRVTRVDIKISHDRIAADGSFDINHHGRSTSHVRHLRGRFYDHGRKVSGVITETAVGGHGGPVTFEAALTKRS